MSAGGWRSVLFTPGTRGDRIQKALETGAADVVVADLEDAVAPDQKAEARQVVLSAMDASEPGRAQRAIRINPWPTSLAEDDLDAVLSADVDLLVIPKAESPDHIRALDVRLGDHPARLLLILETAEGVLNARELARASDRVAAIAFGAEDLAADAGLRRSPENVEVAVPRSLVALAAAATGVAAIDMITADFKDTERTGREASEARALGYKGKMCLHPAQVEVVHQAFAASTEEVAWAKRVMDAVDAAGSGSGGVVVVDGKMVDVPLVRQAQSILAESENATG